MTPFFKQPIIPTPQNMKKTLCVLVTLAIVAMAVSCSQDDQPAEQKRLCEIGTTGKAVSSVSYSKYRDGSQTRIESNATIWYCPDCSKITAYDLSEGIPGMLMKDHSFVLHGDAVIDNDGEVAFSGIKFNDKGYICHLTDFQGFSTSQGTTHVTYDITYNDEDRMSKITYTFLDADEKPTRIQHIDLFWENGLLQSVKFDNDGEIRSTTYEYGNQENVHRQPSASFFNSLNLLSLDIIRPFLTAGYFGKGPDKFEVSSHEPGASVAEDKAYSVELDSEGKLNVLHEAYGEGSHTDYVFTYSNIK